MQASRVAGILTQNFKLTDETGFAMLSKFYTLQHYSQSHRPHSSWLFQDLIGTIPLFHHSIPKAVNGGTVSGAHSCHWLFLGSKEADGFVNTTAIVKYHK